MKEKTDELHERYYKKFWRLKENAPALSGVMDVMRSNLLEEYKTEYAIMHAEDLIENERQLYALGVKGNELIPKEHRYRLFWKRPNRAQIQLNRELEAEIEEFYRRRELALERLIVALERADEDAPADIFNCSAERYTANEEGDVKSEPGAVNQTSETSDTQPDGQNAAANTAAVAPMPELITTKEANRAASETSDAMSDDGNMNEPKDHPETRTDKHVGQIDGQMSMDELEQQQPGDDNAHAEIPGTASGNASAISNKD